MAQKQRGDAFVEFDRVQKSYDGESLVVKELNLKIGKGEFLTMLGPSGSGKTTCLMMLSCSISSLNLKEMPLLSGIR